MRLKRDFLVRRGPEGSDRAEASLHTVADGGHGNQCPPESQRYRIEVIVGIWLYAFGVVDEAGEDHNAEHQEEH